MLQAASELSLKKNFAADAFQLIFSATIIQNKFKLGCKI